MRLFVAAVVKSLGRVVDPESRPLDGRDVTIGTVAILGVMDVE
jgi:hypothetical protein